MQGDAHDLHVLLLAAEQQFNLDYDPAPLRAWARVVRAAYELIGAFVAADRAFRAEHDLSTTPSSRRRVSALANRRSLHC